MKQVHTQQKKCVEFPVTGLTAHIRRENHQDSFFKQSEKWG